MQIDQLFRKTWPRAIKLYTCDGCAEAIRPKEVYLMRVGLLDGAFHYDRLCWHCELRLEA